MFYRVLKKNQKQIFIFLFIILSFFVTFINLGVQKDYLGDDAGLSYYFPKILSKLTTSTWDSYAVPGKINVTSLISIVWYYPLYWLSLLNINGLLMGRLLMFLFLFVSGYGMFLLSIYLIKNYLTKVSQSLIYPSCFLAGLFFMFNQYSLQMVLLPIMPYHLTYMLFPWLFLFLLINLETNFSMVKTIAFTFLLLVFLAGNPSNSLSVIFFLFVFQIFFFKRFKIKTLVLFLSVSFLLFILLSSHLWLPIFINGSNPYGHSQTTNNFFASFIFNSRHTTINNIVRLIGSITFPNTPYFSIFINNFVIILLSYTIPIIILYFLILLIDFKIIVFLGFISVISIFLAKGAQPPFAEGLTYLFTHIPYFEMYRSIYLKFNFFLAFCYSLIIGQGILVYFSKKSNQIFNLSILIFSGLIIINSFPFFTGEAINKNNLTKLPQEYLLLKNKANNLEDGKIISFPPTPQGGGPLFDWENGNKYIGPSQDFLLFDKPALDSYWFIKNKFFNLNSNDSWEGNRFENKINTLINKFGALNIRYILLHKDFDNGLYYGKSLIKKIDNKQKINTLVKKLRNNRNIRLIKETKSYNLYQINDNIYLPQFYIPDQIIVNYNPLNKLLNDHSIVISNQSKLAIVQSNIKNRTNLITRPKITIKKDGFNLNQYNIRADKVIGDFLLVFSESYDKNWKISFMKKPLPESTHILANGYANAWIINPDKLCNNNACIKRNDGSYDLEFIVEFWPQRFFYIGLFISGTTLIICIGYLIYNFFNRNNHTFFSQ